MWCPDGCISESEQQYTVMVGPCRLESKRLTSRWGEENETKKISKNEMEGYERHKWLRMIWEERSLMRRNRGKWTQCTKAVLFGITVEQIGNLTQCWSLPQQMNYNCTNTVIIIRSIPLCPCLCVCLSVSRTVRIKPNSFTVLYSYE